MARSIVVLAEHPSKLKAPSEKLHARSGEKNWADPWPTIPIRGDLHPNRVTRAGERLIHRTGHDAIAATTATSETTCDADALGVTAFWGRFQGPPLLAQLVEKPPELRDSLPEILNPGVGTPHLHAYGRPDHDHLAARLHGEKLPEPFRNE